MVVHRGGFRCLHVIDFRHPLCRIVHWRDAFTPSLVRYRTTFGRVREIPFKDIYRLTRTRIMEGSYRVPIAFAAVELTLLNHERVILSLDLDKGEIVGRLCAATGLPCQKKDGV